MIKKAYSLLPKKNEKLPSDAKETQDRCIISRQNEAYYYEKDLESAIITHLQDFYWN
jgi:hypothetical protein